MVQHTEISAREILSPTFNSNIVYSQVSNQTHLPFTRSMCISISININIKIYVFLNVAPFSFARIYFYFYFKLMNCFCETEALGYCSGSVRMGLRNNAYQECSSEEVGVKSVQSRLHVLLGPVGGHFVVLKSDG